MFTQIKAFLADEEGLTTVEYAIAGSLVGLAVVASFTELGDSVGDVITGLGTTVCTTPAGGTTPCN